jgi:hypothetical protein
VVFTLYNFVHAKVSSKGQCHEILDFRFTAGVADNGGNLPPVSLTPVANLQRWLHNNFF